MPWAYLLSDSENFTEMPQTMNTITARLKAVRAWMAQYQFDAWIQTHEDAYLNEYIAEDAEYLAWLTGFTGSAGVVIITMSRVGLFTDGRYTVHSQQQCPAPVFEHETITNLSLWLEQNTQENKRYGLDSRRLSEYHFAQWQDILSQAGACLHAQASNPIDTLWQDKPFLSVKPAIYLDEKYHGQSSQEKRRLLGNLLQENLFDAVFITQAESICWLLNIRGFDLPCVPVINSVALVLNTGKMAVFCDPRKLSATQLHAHSGSDVVLCDEAHFCQQAAAFLPAHSRVLFVPAHTSVARRHDLQACDVILEAGSDPCVLMRACKNPVETQGMRQAHQRDAIAVCRFLAWLDAQLLAKNTLDEAILADKLASLRAELPLYQGPSFDTISALGPNAAMCHYNHRQTGARTLQTEDALYLVDSGGQYLDGTTDITRTVQVGCASSEHKKLFTLVLRGHIQLAKQQFPYNTNGSALDALARAPLWQIGCDFMHGTGHGVGHFLNVHEGPQRISPIVNSENVLLPSMIVSNEPGYYRTDAFGIRCENILLVCPSPQTTEQPTLCFETLTLVPFDRRLIDINYLTQQDVDWLNQYHKRVWETISPHLDPASSMWLQQATQSI